jgi:hypothetical protein
MTSGIERGRVRRVHLTRAEPETKGYRAEESSAEGKVPVR